MADSLHRSSRGVLRWVSIAIGAVLLAAVGLFVWAQTDLVPSRLKPELSQVKMRALTLEQRWQIDSELLDEAYMKEYNNVRFPGPGSWDQRAAWVAELAQWYPVADAVNQIVDFTRSVMHNNEAAMRRLYDMGQAGDIGAACMAASLYHHHPKEMTARWRLGYEQVARAALVHKDSGNLMCLGVEGTQYFRGTMGYPKDIDKARKIFIKRAAAGSVGNQEFMVRQYSDGAYRFEPRAAILELCWHRVLAQKSLLTRTIDLCGQYREGTRVDWQGKVSVVPLQLQENALRWCDRSKTVTGADWGSGSWGSGSGLPFPIQAFTHAR